MDKVEKTPRRILVVDDNEDIHKSFEMILSGEQPSSQLDSTGVELFGGPIHKGMLSHRYQLDFAAQGEQAVEMVRSAIVNDEQPFLLAFVDKRMPPGWDGLETIARIWELDPRIQVVLCSAYLDYSWEEINHHLGSNENFLILRKPFEISEIAQMANTLTQKWILAREAEVKHEQLDELVECRTREINRVNMQLQEAIEDRKKFESQLIRAQKMEAVGTLAGGVAHDLNNILAGIVSYPDLLMMQIPPDSPLRRPLKTIRQSGKKAVAIVQDMLTLARRGVITRNIVDLKTVVEEGLQSPECQKMLSYHPFVRMTTTIECDLATVIGSEVHLAKSLMNLLSNAAEAMPDEGTITIGLRRVYLDRPIGNYKDVVEGDYVMLSVSDTGTGIAEEDMEHIFEPFYTKKKMGRSGTGLGMAVVWGTVKDHQGYIEVHSRLNSGTTFNLYFPCADRLQVTTAIKEKKELPQGTGQQILVVDDIAEQREIAAQMLHQLGYQAHTVSSGEEAITFLDKRAADLIILDMIMDPGIDGLETYRRIIERHRRQKAIIASGFTESCRIRETQQLGAGALLRKPYSMSDIAVAVSKELARSQGNPNK